jgi:hypothetical protein
VQLTGRRDDEGPADDGLVTAAGATTASPIRLAVLDTGIPEDYASLHSHLADAVAPGPERESPMDPGAGDIRLDAGHGLFILDIACRIAPALKPVYMRRPARDDSNLTFGEALIGQDLWEVAREVTSAGQRLIVNMSFSAPTPDDSPAAGLEGELAWMVGQGLDVLVVAAAGNSGSDQPTWPAAYDLPNVVSVGALDASGHVADFSNRGPWVDCWTSGTDILGAYLAGTYDHPSTYSAVFPETAGSAPWATWNGTSFATPRVAAAIAVKAAGMPGASLLAAWEALRKENRQRHPQWTDPSGAVVTESGVVIDI